MSAESLLREWMYDQTGDYGPMVPDCVCLYCRTQAFLDSPIETKGFAGLMDFDHVSGLANARAAEIRAEAGPMTAEAFCRFVALESTLSAPDVWAHIAPEARPSLLDVMKAARQAADLEGSRSDYKRLSKYLGIIQWAVEAFALNLSSAIGK